MAKELIISADRHETRVALMEDDQVVEVYHQRENEYSLAGSIHKGRVTRVLPGMQSAFVDLGLDRDAFLYVSDFFEDNEEYDKVVTSVEEQVMKLGRGSRDQAPSPPPVEAAAPAEPVAPAETAPAEPAPEAIAAPIPVVEPRREGGDLRNNRDNREGHDNRDHRGRRGRRRGQQRSGHGFPESKFYSVGRRPPEAEAPAPAPAPVSAGSTPDDFIVLPGESLAKYHHEDGAEPEPVSSESEFVAEPQSEDLASEPLADADEAAGDAAMESAFIGGEEAETGETEVVEAAGIPEPPAEEEAPAEPEAPAAEAAAPPAEEPSAAAEPEEPAARPAEESVALAVEEQPAAEQAASDVAEGATAEAGEADSAEAAGEELAAEAEIATPSAEDQPGEPAGTAAPAASEDGPEPARIPTSLTAQLREQSPRYQHRMSRRMRRKNRENRPQPAEGEAQRAPAPPPAEIRTAPAPAEPRPAPRPAPEARAEKPEKSAGPSISDLLKEGQEIIVQIAKEPLGQKGARITSHIALPGRFLVYMPTVEHMGVSRKIPSDEERARLKRILQSNRAGIPGGYIVRTAGEGRSEEELRADMMFLYNLWLDLRQKAERRKAPALIHYDLNVVERVLRDQLTSAFKSIWVDNEETYESVLRFVERFQPALVSRVKLYTRSTPIFDEFGITAELERALRPKVWLKSGGHIVINQTEALVAIDVNTGKFVGKSNRLEDTIVKVNTDAIKEIVRQIRLRDLGGIIVVDFIDMDERKNRQKVMQVLEEAMRADRAPYKILQYNDFGLVAITRKRVKQSLERTLCTPCPYCEGAGYVKSPQTVVGEILQEAHKIAGAVEGKDVMLRVAPEVAKLLKSNQNTYLQELEEILGRTVIVKSDQQLHQERFDLA